MSQRPMIPLYYHGIKTEKQRSMLKLKDFFFFATEQILHLMEEKTEMMMRFMFKC